MWLLAAANTRGVVPSCKYNKLMLATSHCGLYLLYNIYMYIRTEEVCQKNIDINIITLTPMVNVNHSREQKMENRLSREIARSTEKRLKSWWKIPFPAIWHEIWVPSYSLHVSWRTKLHVLCNQFYTILIRLKWRMQPLLVLFSYVTTVTSSIARSQS